jgi:hypothetical protein
MTTILPTIAEVVPTPTLIVNLLRQTTSLTVVADFLKRKDLPHSAAGWDEMLDLRIQPAVDEGRIEIEELLLLLRDAEECGRQHVFLYKTDTSIAEMLIDPARVIPILNQLGLSSLLTSSMILEEPLTPMVVDVRWESANVPLNLTIKVVEQRTSRKFSGNSYMQEGMEHRIYQVIKERAVSLMKLHRDGLLEVRIRSRSNSMRYEDEIARIFAKLGNFFPIENFTPSPLATIKRKLVEDRAALSQLVRFSDSTLKNDSGTVMKLISYSDMSDLNDDEAAADSMQRFMSYDAICDSSNVWFKEAAPKLSKDVHVRLAGQINEFALTANCSPSDYGYVLNQIQRLNK